MSPLSKHTSIECAAIDLAKIFFCFCILFRHTGAYHEIPFSWYFQHGVFCLAVPFFFIASGYFLGRKLFRPNTDLRAEVKKYILRLLYPYIIFSIINTGLTLISLFSTSEKQNLPWELIKVVRCVIFYPYGALWYIWASIIGVLILYFFLKYRRIRTAIIGGILCYLFALICNSYYFLIVDTPIQKIVNLYLRITTSARNGIFVGFPLLGIGLLLAYQKEQLFQKNIVRYAFILFLVSCVFSFLEISWIQTKTTADDHSLFVTQLILIPSLFILLLNCKVKGSKTFYILLRQMSTGIYFIHRPLLTCLRWLFPLFGLTQVSGITQFFILSILCISICFPFYRYNLKSRFLFGTS